MRVNLLLFKNEVQPFEPIRKWFLQIIVQLILLTLFVVGCSSNQSQLNTRQIHHSKISAYDYDEYSLQLFKHDRLVTNISSNQLDVVIFSPVNITLENSKPVAIPKTGNYTIRVLMPRALARRNETYQYELMIAVDRD